MGYDIIFQTKIVRLPDGRILHLSRQGCNNDDEGRVKGEYQPKIYSLDEFLQYAEKFKVGSKPYKDAEYFDIKIGSRYATYYDYGEHLLRMLKRAESYNDLIKNNTVRVEHRTGVHIMGKVNKDISFEQYYDKLDEYRDMPKYLVIEYPKKLDEIIKCVEEDSQHTKISVNPL